MRYQSIPEIYEANDRIRAKLKGTVGGLTEKQAAEVPDGEGWSIAQITEHVSMVGNGIFRICSKLLLKAEAEGHPSATPVDLSSFADRASGIADVKLDAPETVRPSGQRSVAESIKALDETQESFRSLQPQFEKYHTSEHRFPHPYLGDMTALEWLAMYGAHEGRHLRQIRRIMEKLGQS